MPENAVVKERIKWDINFISEWLHSDNIQQIIADEQGLQMPQRKPFQIDIAFAVDEFDFFS